MGHPLLWQKSYWDLLKEKLPEYKFQPHTGKFFLDCLYFTLIVGIQESVIATLTGTLASVDIVTPWLAISILRKKPFQAIAFVFFAASTMESLGSLPFGAFMSAYWIMACIIVTVRPQLSWRYPNSWAFLFLGTSLLSILVEIVLASIITGFAAENFYYFVSLPTRILSAIGFGMYLSLPWLKTTAEEPVPK